MEDIKEILSNFKGSAHAFRCQEILSAHESLKPELGSYALAYCKDHNLVGFCDTILTRVLKEKGPAEAEAEAYRVWMKKGRETIEKNKIFQKQTEIQSNKNSKDKPKMRAIYIELGTFFEEIGNYQEAVNSYTKAIEWNPAESSVLDIYFHLFRVLIFSNNWQRMGHFKIGDKFADQKTDEQRIIFTSCQSALFVRQLLSKEFSQALSILKTEVNPEFLQKSEDYFSREELSLYAAVLLLNCSRRSEMSELVKLESIKLILSGSPLASQLVDAALSFDYSRAVQTLHKITARLKYDPYIASSLFQLSELIFEKLLKQRIKIETVAELFGLEYSTCFELVKKLIQAKQIHFLVEPLQKELIYRAPEESQKAELYRSAIKTISSYLREKHLSLLRYKLNQITMEKNKHNKDDHDIKRLFFSSK